MEDFQELIFVVIFVWGFYAIRRLLVEEYGKLMMNWSYVSNTIVPLATLLLVIGLFFVAIKGPTKSMEVKSDESEDHEV